MDKKVECSVCNGSGERDCPGCTNGPVALPQITSCAACHGSKKVKCKKCDGKGFIELEK